MNKQYYARTHADFLNRAFGTNYKQYPRSVWKNPDGVPIWIVHNDGKIRAGWKTYVYDDKIIEEYVGSNPDKIKPVKKSEYVRIVAKVIDSRVTLLPMYYVIAGLYSLSIEESSVAGYRVWRKPSAEGYDVYPYLTY